MRRQKHRHGSHGGLLDSGLPDPGGPRISCPVGQCPADQKCGGAENRRAGLPVDSALAHVWIAAGFLSSRGSLLRLAHLSSLSGRTDWCPEHSMPTYAEGSATNESPTGSGFKDRKSV